jgi:hypothetical protein
MTTPSDSTPPLHKEAALIWLRDAGQLETTVVALAKEWGWERTRASKALKSWAAAGLITRRKAAGGRTVIFAAPAVLPVHASIPAVNTLAQQSEGTAGVCAGPAAPPVQTSTPALISTEPAVLPVQASSAAVHAVSHPRAHRAWDLQSALMLAAAIGLGLVGLVMNARFAASFGRSNEAAFLLAAIGALIDVLVVMLLSVGCRLWGSGNRAAGSAAWCLWLFVAGMSLLAGAGFGATNIGDAIADRDKVVLEVIGVRATVNRLRAERTASTETRSTAALQAQSERERALIDRGVWKVTGGCHNVTILDSATACGAIMATRQAMAVAARRDAIEAELRAAEEKLATLPAVQSAADPQAVMAADIVAWITATKISFQPEDIARIRIIGLALMPTLSGILLALGMALRRETKVKKRRSARKSPKDQKDNVKSKDLSDRRTGGTAQKARSVSVGKGSRSAVAHPGNAQLALPLGASHGEAA